MSKESISEGKMPTLWRFLVKLHSENPDAFSNVALLEATIAQSWHALKDKKRCPNCQASMVGFTNELDAPNAMMLIAMAQVVDQQIKKGLVFREANQVHVQTMQNATYAMKSRTTTMSKLGLITKALEDGKHKQGKWLITKRGWAALRGERVPKSVEVWRNEIKDRGEGTITLQEVLTAYRGKKKRRQADDLGGDLEYQPSEWVHFSETYDGSLFG